MEEDRIGSIPHIIQQHEFQWNGDLNVRNKIIHTLKENIGKLFYDLKVEKAFPTLMKKIQQQYVKYRYI